MNPEPSLRERIVRHLTEQGAGFRELHHEPTPTSADSARARGAPLGSGLKALLLKADDRFILFALPGDRRLDSASAKRQLGAKATFDIWLRDYVGMEIDDGQESPGPAPV